MGFEAGNSERGEPRLEDILASIKKVIAEDGRIPPRAARRNDEPAFRKLTPRDDILELTETFEADSGESPRDDAHVYDDEDDDRERPLVSEERERAMRESLAALAAISAPGASPQIVRSGETSLEGLVREMLKPMLAQWLDENLPDLVEGIVEREISRITGKRS